MQHTDGSTRVFLFCHLQELCSTVFRKCFWDTPDISDSGTKFLIIVTELRCVSC